MNSRDNKYSWSQYWSHNRDYHVGHNRAAIMCMCGCVVIIPLVVSVQCHLVNSSTEGILACQQSLSMCHTHTHTFTCRRTFSLPHTYDITWVVTAGQCSFLGEKKKMQCCGCNGCLPAIPPLYSPFSLSLSHVTSVSPLNVELLSLL